MKSNSFIITLAIMVSTMAYSQTDDKKSFPCRHGEEYKPLDFWLGEWDVYVNDKISAMSSITKSECGCTLHEDYKTLSEFYGRSMNYFDPVDKIYTQIWVDKFNSVVIFKAVEAREGYLKLQTDDGKGTLTNMDYTLETSSGNVIQKMESSKDGGKTWKNTFTGVYKKKTT